MSICLIALRIGLVTATLPADSACRTAPEAYAIVGGAAVGLLPDELRSMLEARQEAWYASAAVLRTTTTAQPRNTEDHFIALDAPQVDQSADPSVRRFPRSRAKWKRLCKERGIDRGGQLPWVLIDCQRDLVAAFQKGDADTILQSSAAILHLATDACMPFNTTVDPHGHRCGNEIWQVTDASSLMVAHRSVWQRCQIELLRRLGDRFTYEVRVWPGRLQRTADPSELVWTALRSAHESLEGLLETDRELLGMLQPIDAATFLSSEDAYYTALGIRAAPVLKARLESAALLTSELITNAWATASETVAADAKAGADAESESTSKEQAAKVVFVGSRSSQIFHRPTCRHVKRIRPENLVTFPDADGAVQVGRRPCRTCSPVAQRGQ